MARFPRDEIQEMVDRWVAANDEAGESGDWSKMSSFYTEEAIYSWNNGPKWEFVARGREQIHDWVFGTEMSGLDRWTYPYVRRLIDEADIHVFKHNWQVPFPFEREHRVQRPLVQCQQ